MLKFGLRRCHSYHSVFSHTSARGKILLIVYIDDIIITGDDKKDIIITPFELRIWVNFVIYWVLR